MKTTEKPKIKIIEMAKKRRHIHLLEKMQRGKAETPALSKAEISELERLERDPSSPGVVDSQEKVAKVFGVSVRSVQHWVKDGMPVTSQGEYDLIEIRAWRAIRKEKRSSQGKDKSKDYWEMRFRRAKALMAETALKVEKGQLVSRAIGEQEIIAICLITKSNFLNFAHTLPPQLEGKTVREMALIIGKQTREVCSKLAAKETYEIIISKGRAGHKFLELELDKVEKELNEAAGGTKEVEE